MNHNTATSAAGKTALVTGAARRLGAAIATDLHQAGLNVVLHYRSSRAEAEQLARRLETHRPGSTLLLKADLRRQQELTDLVAASCQRFGGLDVLVNNASVFEPTPVGAVDHATWERILESNLKAPFFLCQAALATLRERSGSIVNIIDVYAERPLANHPLYCSSKAALAMLTRSLAHDLAPTIRVNGVSPGAILWPESGPESHDSTTQRTEILAKIPMGRAGTTTDVAGMVTFLALQAPYVTGQIVTVDGGRSLNM